MPRSQGAHPIVLLWFAFALFVANSGAMLYCVDRINYLQPRVKAAQAALDNSQNTPGNDDASIASLASSTRRFSSDAGQLAGYRELSNGLLIPLWVTAALLAGSVIWVRAPRTS